MTSESTEPPVIYNRRKGDQSMASFLALLIVCLYGAVQWHLLTNSVAGDMREIVMRALGTLDASVGLVLGFYFGSSAQR